MELVRAWWRSLKLRRQFNAHLRDVRGVIRVVEGGFVLLRWDFRFFQLLEKFCGSMPPSRQETLRAGFKSVLEQQQGDAHAALEFCSPSLKRILKKGSRQIDAVTYWEFAVTRHLSQEELIALSENPRRISWNQVREIIGYKADHFTVDEVRLGFVGQDGTGTEVGEDMLGWRPLLAEMMKRFPEIDPNWEEKIMHPAFEQNLTHLWPVSS